jgi:hypothetical protein
LMSNYQQPHFYRKQKSTSRFNEQSNMEEKLYI